MLKYEIPGWSVVGSIAMSSDVPPVLVPISSNEVLTQEPDVSVK